MKNYIKTDGNHFVLELQLNVLVFRQGDFYVSYCPSLELSSYGDSVQDAKDGFDDAMRTYLDESHQNGTLQDDLVKHGWKVSSDNTKKAEPPAKIELDIPAGLLTTQFNENWSVPVY